MTDNTLDKLEKEIRGRYGDDSLIFSFDKLDHEIAKTLNYKQFNKTHLLPTIKDDCLCKWTRVSEGRACGNHSPVIYRVRELRKILASETQKAEVRAVSAKIDERMTSVDPISRYLKSDMNDDELKHALHKLFSWGLSTGRLLAEGKIKRIDEREWEQVGNTFDRFASSFMNRAKKEWSKKNG